MLNKKGFTLVELLAVIVILAIILAVAIPGISGVVKSATKNAFQGDAEMVLTAVNYKSLEDETFVSSSVNETNIKTLLNLDDSNYERLTVKEVNGVLYVTIVGQNKWDGLTVSGTKNVIQIDNTVDTFVRGANAPVLATNMVPIKWVDGACVEGVCADGTWEDTTATDPEWYNYDTATKRWANARTVDGSMWVWIPRYIYKISSGWHTNAATGGTIDIQFTKGVDDNWNKGDIGNIDLGETANASDDKWTNHPAFTFGDTELTGFWMAKFEPSVEGTTCYTNESKLNCDLTSLVPKFLPNKATWRWATPGTFYTVGRQLETNSVYGWGNSGTGIDTHMIKNVEWGAVAYLAQSSYGKNAQVWINNAWPWKTGCAGNSVSANSVNGCQNTYDKGNGPQASTTGNIYGIYDMSGGAYEFTAAYLNNGNADLNNCGLSILSADAKYKDVYTAATIDNEVNNYALAINKKGDVIYETSGAIHSWTGTWYESGAYMARASRPWFWFGGERGEETGAGIFAFTGIDGNFDDGGWSTFRSVLVVGAGL